MDEDWRESGLSRSVWSDADFEDMGWHDATIHGFYIQETDEIHPRLLVDLDYILRWVHPVPPAQNFQFWISPCTLVFDNVWDLEANLSFKGEIPELEIADIHRFMNDSHDGSPLWHVEGHSFDFKFRASGYHQYIRQPPQFSSGQSLSHAERGGCSFAELSFN